ncbi:hypothetical protein E2C01_071957 [Portunus trituberculatus]|uniref:Uncharacterized protein n=1 Tax=Portunus trituberculatus TaxID=210409 RepID=A0A5B7HWQ1_PORTR|nr:hypothetical protein [Portunus trituberculatus]
MYVDKHNKYNCPSVTQVWPSNLTTTTTTTTTTAAAAAAAVTPIPLKPPSFPSASTKTQGREELRGERQSSLKAFTSHT